MAQIKEELIVIKVSQMIRDKGDDTPSLIDDEFMATIEPVVQELVGNKAIVEIVNED